jgi:hypothetical protein
MKMTKSEVFITLHRECEKTARDMAHRLQISLSRSVLRLPWVVDPASICQIGSIESLLAAIHGGFS